MTRKLCGPNDLVLGAADKTPLFVRPVCLHFFFSFGRFRPPLRVSRNFYKVELSEEWEIIASMFASVRPCHNAIDVCVNMYSK